jgi:hypothetical protein
MPQARNTRSVQCYHCGHRFEVGPRAMTISCPSCYKPLKVDDVVVKTMEAVRRIQTCGRVVVQKTGRVYAQLVEAQEGVEVQGVMEAKVVSGGPVLIGKKATWKGDCRAPTLAVELGGTIVSGFFEISLGEPAPPDASIPVGG